MRYLCTVLPLLAVASPSPILKRHSGVKIQSARNGRCLSPKGEDLDNVRVVAIECDRAKTWDIVPGRGPVIRTGTNLALNAGTGQDNNEVVVLKAYNAGDTIQTWYLTEDNRIAIEGGDQCLDQGDDIEGTQTYQCSPGNGNQEWRILNADGTPVGPGPNATRDNNSESEWVDNAALSVEAFGTWLTVTNAQSGSPLVLSPTLFDPAQTAVAAQQRFTINEGGTGPIQLSRDETLCIDSTGDSSSGGGLRLMTCVDADGSQTWEYKNNRLRLSQTNRCATGQVADSQDASGSNAGSSKVVLELCDDNRKDQEFHLEIKPTK
ncbi:hypothetical protein I317_02716 [Kwoniella heveanensis CBS 569]|nr:hypothetical protein I317_02716 [Kwoniella heveanensis CBS 569]